MHKLIYSLTTVKSQPILLRKIYFTLIHVENWMKEENYLSGC